MSRQADRLVGEIRARRPRVRRDLQDLTSVREIERRFHRAPGRWLLGTAVMGLLGARFFAPQIASRARGAARSWILGRLGRTFVTVAVAAAGTPGRESRKAQPGHPRGE